MEKTIKIKCKGADELPFEELEDFQGNLKDLTEDDFEKLKREIVETGFSFPVKIWKSNGKNYIIGGHQTKKTLKRMQDDGWVIPKIPVVWIEADNYQEAKRKILSDASNYGHINKDGLLEFCKDAEISIQQLTQRFRFPEINLNALMGGNQNQGDGGDVSSLRDRAEEMLSKWKVETGQIWEIESKFCKGQSHRIICGDSTREDVVELLLGDLKPNLMVTDPPYGVEYDPIWREGIRQQTKDVASIGNVSNDDQVDWSKSLGLFPGNVAYVWHACIYAANVANQLETIGFEIRSQIIWSKQHFAISRGHYHYKHEPCWYSVRKGYDANWQGDRSQVTVWEAANTNAFGGHKQDEADKATGHGTQKPLLLFEKPILNHTKVGDYIYEPFSGSGTALVAAERTGRICCAIELEPKYVSIALQRMEDLGLKPKLMEE